MGEIVEKLITGRDLTKQLQILMRMPCRDDMVVSKRKELVVKILESLTQAITVMSSVSCENSDEVSQILPRFRDRGSVDSRHSSKRPMVKDPRGDYKRRKSSDSRIKISSSIVDGYLWRKYGQKETHNATYPRGYFRCTHKHDQDCKATKQVQRIQQEPIKYQITYFGHHTCREISQPNLENLIFNSYSQESNLINFQSYTSSMHRSPSWPDSVQEENKEVQSDITSGKSSSSSDSIAWEDVTPLMGFETNQDFLHDAFPHAPSLAYCGIHMDFFSECDNFAKCFESVFWSCLRKFQ